MTKRRNWADWENDILAACYMDMLNKQFNGIKYSKAALTRAVLPELDNRTRGSWEAKLMNFSAFMVSTFGDDYYVTGYKPLGHAQKSLSDSYMRYLTAKPDEYVREALARINGKFKLSVNARIRAA